MTFESRANTLKHIESISYHEPWSVTRALIVSEVVRVGSDLDLFCESSARVFPRFRTHVKSGAASATLQPHHF